MFFVKYKMSKENSVISVKAGRETTALLQAGTKWVLLRCKSGGFRVSWELI